jgi:thiamine-phosphate pyrophosphorylase
MILGVSVSSPGEAVAAIESGADYLGVGAMFATGTKEDAEAVSMETLREIRALTSLPIVVIGGINRDTAPRFEGTGVDGLAVVSAVVGAADIEAAARELRQIVKSWGRRAR